VADNDSDKLDDSEESNKSEDVESDSPGQDVDPNAPALVKTLRKVDGYIGVGELALLCLFLVIMIGSGVWETYAFFTKTNEAKPAELIKFSVFFGALTGAALAAQRGQMISMDIISRLLSPKTRAWVRVVTTIFTVAMCFYMVKKGWQVYDVKAAEAGKKGAEHYYYFNQAHGALAVALAGVMLAFHFTLHTVVDVAYLATGKVPPEDDEVKVH